jgi:predicted nucleic acid-binding protein
VDTSAWIETIRERGDPAVRAQVTSYIAEDKAVLCDMVRLELWNGARSTKDQRTLREMEEELETVPTTPEIWALACELARLARSKGLSIPASDLVIAACAEHHRLTLIHQDSHFDRLLQLRAEA